MLITRKIVRSATLKFRLFNRHTLTLYLQMSSVDHGRNVRLFNRHTLSLYEFQTYGSNPRVPIIQSSYFKSL